MANPEHVERIKRGMVRWYTWRAKNPGVRPDLVGANLVGANLNSIYLSGADLSGANLVGADLNRTYLNRTDLSGANLSSANLVGANLDRADLRGADLRGADLRGANLSDANLRDANLSGADLRGANLSSANLSSANLSSAIMWDTILANADLRTTKGLTEIEHQGPSTIRLHTVQLPQDGSAQHFLRGAGIPDEWIDFWRSTAIHPIQYHSLFISYSSKDEALARRLHNDLQAQGVRCWFAPEDLKIGSKIRQRIDEAIHLQDKLLILLSAHALASDWVEAEVEAALDKEQRQGREVLFPIRLDEQVMQAPQAWASHLHRTRHIGDFTAWENAQAYQTAFERLLRDLKQN